MISLFVWPLFFLSISFLRILLITQKTGQINDIFINIKSLLAVWLFNGDVFFMQFNQPTDGGNIMIHHEGILVQSTLIYNLGKFMVKRSYLNSHICHSMGASQ